MVRVVLGTACQLTRAITHVFMATNTTNLQSACLRCRMPERKTERITKCCQGEKGWRKEGSLLLTARDSSDTFLALHTPPPHISNEQNCPKFQDRNSPRWQRDVTPVSATSAPHPTLPQHVSPTWSGLCPGFAWSTSSSLSFSPPLLQGALTEDGSLCLFVAAKPGLEGILQWFLSPAVPQAGAGHWKNHTTQQEHRAAERKWFISMQQHMALPARWQVHGPAKGACGRLQTFVVFNLTKL